MTRVWLSSLARHASVHGGKEQQWPWAGVVLLVCVFHLAFQKQLSIGAAYRPFPSGSYLPQRTFLLGCWDIILQAGDVPLKVPSSLQCPGAEGLCLSSIPSNKPVSRAKKTWSPCPKALKVLRGQVAAQLSRWHSSCRRNTQSLRWGE